LADANEMAAINTFLIIVNRVVQRCSISYSKCTDF
jgi:hypothetical protein